VLSLPLMICHPYSDFMKSLLSRKLFPVAAVLLITAVFFFLMQRDRFPNSLPPSQPSTSDFLIHLSGSDVFFSPSLRRPLAVHYIIRRLQYPIDSPPPFFSLDPRVSLPVDLKSQKVAWLPLVSPSLQPFLYPAGSPYVHSVSGCVPVSFPTTPRLWRTLADYEAFSTKDSSLSVYCGGLYRNSPPLTASGVPIPYALFAILFRDDGRYLAFMIPQDPPSGDLASYLVSLSDIDKRTGFLFLPSVHNRNSIPNLW